MYQYNNKVFDDDRMSIELFDGIALNNGYDSNSLPKIWTILRAVFNFKQSLKH